MSKIIDAQNTLFAARNCVECISLAASGLDEDTYPIQGVADIAATMPLTETEIYGMLQI